MVLLFLKANATKISAACRVIKYTYPKVISTPLEGGPDDEIEMVNVGVEIHNAQDCDKTNRCRCGDEYYHDDDCRQRAEFNSSCSGFLTMDAGEHNQMVGETCYDYCYGDFEWHKELKRGEIYKAVTNHFNYLCKRERA